MFKNIDGVTSNFDLFSTEITSTNDKLSVITLAETNLDECNKNLFTIRGYQSVYQSKITGKHKGSGLAIYLKDVFLHTKKDELSQCTPHLESLFISINNTDNPLTIGVIYRPPNGDHSKFLAELQSLFKMLPQSNFYLTGDFNIDLHKHTAAAFEDIMFGNGFSPLISIATHFKPGCSPSCIDNILTNSTDLVVSSGVCKPVVTHHCPVFCLVSTNWKSSETPKVLPKYDYNESNMTLFENTLHNYLQRNNFNQDNLNTSESNFENLVKKINELVDECFQMDINILSSRRNIVNNPWISIGIITSIKTKDHYYNEWRKSIKKLKTKAGDPSLYLKYKVYRKSLKGIVNDAKRKHHLKQFDKANGNSKETWKVINEIRGKQKVKIKPSFIIDGTLVEERRIIANGFNNYFTSIASKLNESENELLIEPLPKYTDYIKNSVESSIFLADSSPEEIIEIIKELSSNKASDIPIIILKRCSHMMSPILAKFFNSFSNLGLFPSILKTGIVSPVFKKDNPQLFENYRPISTLPIFSKLFEKIIYKRIYAFLIAKNILYEKQFGFRKNHSTSHAINYSVKYVADNIEQKKHVVGIFLDLSKAFDTICHSKLLVKLQNYGIRGNCLELIKSYLSSRKQITKFDDVMSDAENILFGVPQGSVLGPLLFLIYINDIVHSSTQGEFVIFADDTNIFIAAKTKKED